MALTIKTTGLAAKAKFVIGVDDDNTVKVFKSVNSSDTDNTSSVQTDMTVSGSLTYSTMTWGGGSGGGDSTVRTVKSNGTSYVQFGTNKPFLMNSSSATNGLLCVYLGKFTNTGAMFEGAGGGRIPYLGEFSGNPAHRYGGTFFTLGTSSPSVGTQMIVASLIKGSASTNNRIYVGTDTGTVADDGYTGNSNFESAGNDSIAKFLTDGSGTFWAQDVGLYLFANDDYASAALRIADLESLLQDPYGYLFDSSGSGATLGGSSVSVARGTTGVNASVSL